MMRLLVASRNAKKLRELRRVLDAAGVEGVELLSLADVADYPETVEDGDSFAANAALKARDGVRHTGLPTLADDSGIVVDALDGLPGIYSARFSSMFADAGSASAAAEQNLDTDSANNALLLRRLEGQDNRAAHYVSSCVLAVPPELEAPLADLGGEGDILSVEGTWHGTILTAPRGENGFGYDPLFEPAETPGRTSAELSAEEKDALSHRGAALSQLVGPIAALARAAAQSSCADATGSDAAGAQSAAPAAQKTPAEIVADSDVDLGWLEDLYTRLHQHPELSGAEEWTAATIAEELQRFPDWDVTTHIGGYGIVAQLHNGPGPTVLMRADFDGLPVAETTGVPYASKHSQLDAHGQRVPTMHACGHDHHTTSLLGAMAVLDAERDHWSGTVVALFQPAEEASIGAQLMVSDDLGSLIPRPDVCLAQHVIAGPAGRIYTAPGPVMTSSTTIEIRLFGRGAHASMPHRSIDPVVLMASTVMKLQTIVAREVPPHKFAVITVASVEAGRANNVIPDSAKISLSCRFYDEELRKKCVDAIKRIVRAEAAAAGADREPEFTFVGLLQATDNTESVFDTVRPAFDAAFGEDSQDMEPWTASEDFPVIPRHFDAPYMLWTVGITPRDQWDRAEKAGRLDIDVPTNHNPNFLPDLSTLPVGVRAASVGILACLQGTWPEKDRPRAAQSAPTSADIDAVAVETSPAV